MLDKVKIPGTSKPAFKWLGVTPTTHSVFDADAARRRSVKQYGGGGREAAACAAAKRAAVMHLSASDRTCYDM